MNREQIIGEIKRTAAENGAKPLGAQRFESETGIKPHIWGKFWARFGDALQEAGFSPNSWQVPHDETYVMQRLAELARELGHIPTRREIIVKRTNDPTFPNHRAKALRLQKSELVRTLASFCSETQAYEDVTKLCASASTTKLLEAGKNLDASEDGFVYIAKAGKYYKIGKTNHAGRRERELAIQLPERIKMVHVIKTDDPAGIEAYWHNRFGEKRKNGEWFDLSAEDISAFRRRKFM